jgi:hypothetical protein
MVERSVVPTVAEISAPTTHPTREGTFRPTPRSAPATNARDRLPNHSPVQPTTNGGSTRAPGPIPRHPKNTPHRTASPKPSENPTTPRKRSPTSDPAHTTPRPTHTSNNRTRQHEGRQSTEEARPRPDKARRLNHPPKRAKRAGKSEHWISQSDASEAKQTPKSNATAKRAAKDGCWSTHKATGLGQQKLAPWGSGGSPPRVGTKKGEGVETPNRVGEGGVEPPRPYGHTDLNRARLPFRHSPRVNVAKPTRSAIGFAHRTVLQARHGYDRPRSTSVEGGTHGRHRRAA